MSLYPPVTLSSQYLRWVGVTSVRLTSGALAGHVAHVGFEGDWSLTLDVVGKGS